jgi:ATP-binding cassette, subfamily B (MDR/TAP), member 1
VAAGVESGCTSNCTTAGDVVAAVFSVTFASVQLGRVSVGAAALQSARAAAAAVYATIDRTPAIDSASTDGAQPDAVLGALEINSVAFHYPSRPIDAVYTCLNLHIAAGESLALVSSTNDKLNSSCFFTQLCRHVLLFLDAVAKQQCSM